MDTFAKHMNNAAKYGTGAFYSDGGCFTNPEMGYTKLLTFFVPFALKVWRRFMSRKIGDDDVVTMEPFDHEHIICWTTLWKYHNVFLQTLELIEDERGRGACICIASAATLRFLHTSTISFSLALRMRWTSRAWFPEYWQGLGVSITEPFCDGLWWPMTMSWVMCASDNFDITICACWYQWNLLLVRLAWNNLR